MKDVKNMKAYLVGSGVASLASAVYLIRDGHISGKNIFIFEESDKNGGSLDADGSPEKKYITRGGRMFEEHYGCTFDFLSGIPSLIATGKSVKEEIFDFNKKHKAYTNPRLLRDGKRVDLSSFSLSQSDRFDLIKIMIQTEGLLGTSSIADNFNPSFFNTNFWYLFCTTFAFEPWHSAVEFRRYILRFLHLFPGSGLRALSGIWRTPYNQYDSIVVPVVSWLKKQGVNFEMNSKAIDFDFDFNKNKGIVNRLYYIRGGKKYAIALNDGDIVISTIGSMTANSNFGSMSRAPELKTDIKDGDWLLWENISKKYPDLGRPNVFNGQIEKSKWESFTITLNDPLLLKLINKISDGKKGDDAFITIVDSNWLLSVTIPHQPYFINQPENITVFGGYALFPDKIGNYVNKKMSDCTGEEILMEIISHLKFTKDKEYILKTATCIPCMMPFITSQFLVRAPGDRPPVIPQNSKNFAFVGQFVEIPDDTVFTVEYSVRSAQTAVFSLLGLDKKPTPLYKGYYGIDAISKSIMAMFE